MAVVQRVPLSGAAALAGHQIPPVAASEEAALFGVVAVVAVVEQVAPRLVLGVPEVAEQAHTPQVLPEGTPQEMEPMELQVQFNCQEAAAAVKVEMVWVFAATAEMAVREVLLVEVAVQVVQ